MACGFKTLEFGIVCMSLSAALLVASTIFDPKTLVVDAVFRTTIEDKLLNTNPTDANYETSFFGYVVGAAIVATPLVLFLLRCCPSQHQIKRLGRKAYMLRFVQCMKLGTLASVPLFGTVGLIKYKTGEALVVGAALMVCEVLSAVLELLLLMQILPSTSKRGVFATTTIALMGSAMVAAQLIHIQELRLLVAASGVSACLALVVTVCVREPETVDKLITPVGFASGLGLAVAFEGTHQFKPLPDLVAYTILFGFNFILPELKNRYEAVAIPIEYERSYHRAALLHNQA